MVKHTQTIRRLEPTNCLSVFDHYDGLTLKGLSFFFTQSFYKAFCINQTDIYLLKVNKGKIGIVCGICSKITIKTPDSLIVLVFSLLTLTLNWIYIGDS